MNTRGFLVTSAMLVLRQKSIFIVTPYSPCNSYTKPAGAT